MEKTKDEILRSIYPATRDTEGNFAWTEEQIYKAMEAYHTQFTQQGEQSEETATALDQLSYWHDRCKAAEKYIKESPCDPDITADQIKAHSKWKDLKDRLPQNVEQGEQIVYVPTEKELMKDRAVKCLADLVQLKNYKEAYGSTEEYLNQKPILWEDAREIIHKLFSQ